MTEPTPANLLTILDRDPEKCSGAWIFRGTRVPVHALFENLKDGASIDQFLEWFGSISLWNDRLGFGATTGGLPLPDG
jgi:uncharacterized protein (DUF433 family)